MSAYQVWIDGPSYRGYCGHKHRTLRGAVKCLLKWCGHLTIDEFEGKEMVRTATIEEMERYPLPPLYLVHWSDREYTEEVEI